MKIQHEQGKHVNRLYIDLGNDENLEANWSKADRYFNIFFYKGAETVYTLMYLKNPVSVKKILEAVIGERLETVTYGLDDEVIYDLVKP